MMTARWRPDRSVPSPTWPVPRLGSAITRGLLARCPGCGEARLFSGFVKVVSICPCCDAPLGRARADDAPPYFVILITGHILVPLLLLMQKWGDPPAWELAAIFLPLTLVLALVLLRPVKGAILGTMLSLGMVELEPRLE
jgi:uncharacterized protein (DUF983 family)